MRLPTVLFLVLIFATDVSSAELSSREKRIIDTVNLTVRKAGVSFQAGKFDESAEHIRRAMKQIEIATATGSTDVYDSMLPAMKRVATAHAMLELEGRLDAAVSHTRHGRKRNRMMQQVWRQTLRSDGIGGGSTDDDADASRRCQLHQPSGSDSGQSLWPVPCRVRQREIQHGHLRRVDERSARRCCRLCGRRGGQSLDRNH